MEGIYLAHEDLFSFLFQHFSQGIHLKGGIAGRGEQPCGIVQTRFYEQTIILKIVILYLIDIVGRDRASDQVVQEGEVETPASATGEHCDRMDERIPAVTDMISQLIAGGGEIV